MFPHSIKSQQFQQALQLTAGVITSPRRIFHPRGRACKKSVQIFFSEVVWHFKSLAHFLSLYIAKHTQLVPKTKQLSAASQNRARKSN